MYHLQFTQTVPASPERVWRFFSRPANLARLMPGDVAFAAREELPDEMYAGALLRYRTAPLLHIPFNWTAHITHLVEEKYFIDEMLEGPFRYWHHEHHFSAARGGTLIRDLLYYQLPLGFLGKLFHPLIVKEQVSELFEARKAATAKIFAPSPQD